MCLCFDVHICFSAYVCAYVCVPLCVYVFVWYVCLSICVCLCMWLCLCNVCVCVCVMYVFVCVLGKPTNYKYLLCDHCVQGDRILFVVLILY